MHSNIETFDGLGNDYVEDLNFVLKMFNEDFLITSGDLPLLDEIIIRDIVNRYDAQNQWTSFLVTHNFLNSLNLKSDYSVNVDNRECHFTGISLVNSKEIG